MATAADIIREADRLAAEAFDGVREFAGGDYRELDRAVRRLGQRKAPPEGTEAAWRHWAAGLLIQCARDNARPA